MSDDIKIPLEPLDPGFEDPTFWYRFQGRVMKAALPELARRRWSPDLTMSQVMTSWGRMLVPASVAAAIVASFFLVRADDVPVVPHLDAIEALLVAEGEELPFLRSDSPPDAAQFLLAVERR